MNDKEKYLELMQRYFDAETSPDEEKELALYAASTDDPAFEVLRGVLGYIGKVNTVERLGNHLKEGVDKSVQEKYLWVIRDWVPDEPVVLIDDSDVVKPEGKKFEALGVVRDGSESTEKKSVFKKGYHVTEAVALMRNRQPVSIFSRIHSSAEKDYASANAVTFDAIEQGAKLFGKATFVMDRGYDDNKMFNKLDALKQDYVIRLTAKRKVLYRFYSNYRNKQMIV